MVTNIHEGGYKSRGDADRHYCIFTLEHVKNHLVSQGFLITELKYVGWEGKIYSVAYSVFERLKPFRHLLFPRISATAMKQD